MIQLNLLLPEQNLQGIPKTKIEENLKYKKEILSNTSKDYDFAVYHELTLIIIFLADHSFLRICQYEAKRIMFFL